MRETVKQVKIGPEGEENTFQIHKMNALAGSYLLKFCAEKLLPVYNSIQEIFKSPDTDGMTDEQIQKLAEDTAKKRADQLVKVIPEALSKLPEEEMMAFEIRCLQTVEILKAAGWQKVMIGNNFGDEDLEYDIATVMRLVYEVLAFNLGSFFGDGGLNSLLNRKNSSLPNV